MNLRHSLLPSLLAVLLIEASTASMALAGDHRDERQRDDRRQSQIVPVQVIEAQPMPGPRPQREGRLSAEERKALRRQINDAGHDLYQPRR